jgi:hypothetical protein
MNIETEFIDIKHEETSDSPFLEEDDSDRVDSITSSIQEGSGVQDVSCVANFPT